MSDDLPIKATGADRVPDALDDMDDLNPAQRRAQRFLENR